MAIFNKFFQFIEKVKNSNRFFKYLSNNKTVMDNWLKIKWYLYYLPNDNPSYNDFFKLKQNASRVDWILNKLVDEKSKRTYSSIIEYRTTSRRKDYSLKLYDPIQYFTKGVGGTLGNDEVLIDCGAYDGDTIDNFIKYCPNYKQIVAFEPETVNFEQLQTKYGNNPKIMLLNAGAWHKEETVSFAGSGVFGMILAGGGDLSDIPAPQRRDLLDTSRIERRDLLDTSRIEREESISTKSIDSLELDKVTFIKMDIEGAEMNALKGASKTILRDKPKLAISIYHSNEDMLDIPEYIHSLVPEYKFYVRQHWIHPWIDTVLYAVM